MKVLLGGVEYEIVFAYWTSADDDGGPVRRVGCSLGQNAVIGGVKASVVANQGTARCHPNDNFSKEIGRKLALTRALAGFSKAERAAVWAVYLSRGKKAEVA